MSYYALERAGKSSNLRLRCQSCELEKAEQLLQPAFLFEVVENSHHQNDYKDHDNPKPIR